MLKEFLLIPLALCGSATKVPQKLAATSNAVYTENSSDYVQGVYNFRDYLDFDTLNTYMSDHDIPGINKSFTVDRFPPESGTGQPLDGYINPCSYTDLTYFVYKLDFEFAHDDYIDLKIHYYYALSIDSYWSVSISSNTNLSDLTWQKDFIVDFRNGFVLDDYCNQLFNFFFTTEDNSYVTRYSGYFTWFGYSYYSNPFTCLGTEVYTNNLYYNLYTIQPGGVTQWDSLVMDYCDFNQDDYQIYNMYRYATESVPFKLENMSKRMLVDWKLSKSSYQKLQTYGTFGYIRDGTYDDADFQDLLFSIMDSPFYMISRFLNWQLFGVNLFVAFTGLLTLAVILVLIRKFW